MTTASRQREIALTWARSLRALGGEAPDPARLAALGLPQQAERLARSGRHAMVVAKAYCEGSVRTEIFRIWHAQWFEAAREAAALLAQARPQ